MRLRIIRGSQNDHFYPTEYKQMLTMRGLYLCGERFLVVPEI